MYSQIFDTTAPRAILTSPTTAFAGGGVALATLIVMEVVLGIDNLIFISILTNRLPEDQRSRGRRIGISLALILRLGLLGTVAFIVQLTEPIFAAFGHGFSWRDLILIAGGLFLVWKATKEIHHNVDPDPGPDMFDDKGGSIGFGAAIGQILLLDLVPAEGVQGSLFLRPDEARRVSLMRAMPWMRRSPTGASREAWASSICASLMITTSSTPHTRSPSTSPRSSSTMMRVPPESAAGLSPSCTPRSITGTTWPRRFITPATLGTAPRSDSSGIGRTTSRIFSSSSA